MPMDYTSDIKTQRGMSPSLGEQTPGMDATREVRDIAMRQWAWARENKGITISLMGGLVAIGFGTWLILRARRPTRLEMLRDKGSDLADWIRSKIS